MATRATLELVGVPGEAVAIFPETQLDAPPAAIFEGQFPSAGRLRLRVPRAALLVVASGFGKTEVRFGEGQNFQQLDVRPADLHS